MNCGTICSELFALGGEKWIVDLFAHLAFLLLPFPAVLFPLCFSVVLNENELPGALSGEQWIEELFAHFAFLSVVKCGSLLMRGRRR